ncbi:MAG: fused MFS/spermidine synthase [Pirellulales bacterium]|nr:fused MFS/spermidine synthase [Pirellulales bacterium]
MKWKQDPRNLMPLAPCSAYPVHSVAFSFAISCLGLSAFLTQLTLMRELVSAFSGNELVFGIVLGNWMLLTGIGSTLGKIASRLRAAVTIFLIAEVFIALLPLASVFLLRILRNVVFLRGAELGVTETVVSCFVVLAPYCLVTGYVLPLACQIASPSIRGSGGIGRVYLLDNLGNVLGGFAFLVVLVHWLDHYGMLYFAAVLNLFSAGFLAATAGKRVLATGLATILVGLLGMMALVNLNAISHRLEYSGQKIVFYGTSPYGSLVVTELAGQLNFIENGIPLFSTDNVGQIEETVHYAMAQRPAARRVLLVCGGVSGVAREILKYPVEAVDYVELDPLILDVAQQYLPDALADPRIHVINTDGRLFVRKTKRRYDVVIVDVPDPSTSQLNRFYTREFFGEVHRILKPGGVLSFSMGTYENYLSQELARLVSVLRRTLEGIYANVLILPGGRVFFLASNGELTADVARRIEEAEVQTRLVSRDYLKGMFTSDRMDDIRRASTADAARNEDFNPILYYYHLRYWMSQFQFRFGVLESGLVILLLIYLVRLRPVPLVVFCGGFAASALEVVLLLTFQVLFGSVYYQVGMIVTMFMLGLVIGAALSDHWLLGWDRCHLIYLAVAMVVFAASLPLVLWGLRSTEGSNWLVLGRIAIPLLTLLLAVLVGMQFPLAARVDFRGPAVTSAGLYTADYLGAALGALLVSTLLIPLLGVFVVCLLVAGLNLVAATVMLMRNG